jgi:small-conductance mechanosensitive channel
MAWHHGDDFMAFVSTPMLNWLAAGLHLAVLIGIEIGLNALISRLGVDHLSLLNNPSRGLAILRAFFTRFKAWLWGCGLYTLAAWYLPGLFSAFGPGFSGFLHRQSDVLSAITWLCASSLLGRVIYVTNRRLRSLASSEGSHWESVVATFVADLIQIGLPFVTMLFVLPRLGLPREVMENSREIINILIVFATGYFVCRQVNLAADKIILGHKVRGGVDLRSRALYTEVTALRKVIIGVIIFLTATTGMLFSTPLRQLGTSLLASAGLFSVVAGVAAQRSLGQVLAGFQLALTQPILLDDIVVVQGEFGRVEEITLAYVVIHLWDQRRLVVPISQFLEKPFENWTRRTSEILGTVLLYFDYRVPVDELRHELDRYLQTHPDWDKRVGKIQVTEAREGSVQLRALVSAADPDKLWSLRCDVRERLIGFVHKNYPDCLPRARVMLHPDSESVSGSDLTKLDQAETEAFAVQQSVR